MDWRGGFERERREAGRGRVVLSNRPFGAGTMPLMDLPVGFPRSPKPPKSFSRSELARTLFEHFGTNSVEGQEPRLKRREEAERLVICLLDEIARALERGMRVELRGLGAFNVRAKRERQGRNPRTGEALTIYARRVLRFRASERLLARLNRRTNQRPQRPPAPRQLAFPIHDPQENRADMEAASAPALLAGRPQTGRQRSSL
jgi:integration host factor subunit beta